jgi:hypothetical protein
MSMKVMYSSGTPEWGTPQSFFDALDKEFHFELDVCASKVNANLSRSAWPSPVSGRELVRPAGAAKRRALQSLH